MFDGLRRDLTHGLQLVRRQPGVTLVVAAVVGLGIGVNTMVFTVANALLFREPTSVRAPEQLLRIYARQDDGRRANISYPQYTYLQERAPVFAGLAAYSNGSVVMVRRNVAAEQASAVFVTGNLFPVLGTRPALGRLIQPADDMEGAAPVAVLSHGYWQRALGSDPTVLGSTLAIFGKTVTVVGVATPEFRSLAFDDETPDLWLPVWTRPNLLGRSRTDMVRTPGQLHTFMTGVGRLAAGNSPEQARAVVDAVGVQLATAYPNEEKDRRLTAVAQVSISPDRRIRVVSMLRVLSGIAFIVLTIACANLANLMLVRASGRVREVGVRLSLGATRWQLLRQFLSETLVLSVLGGGVGILFSTWSAALLARQLPLASAQPADIVSQNDWRVFAFAAAVALLSAIGFGLAPAFHAARTPLADVLRSGTRVAQSGSRTRTVLLVMQLTLTLTLLIGSALLVRSVQALRAVPIGYQTDHTLFASFNLRPLGYDPRSAAQLYNSLLERVRGMPGVSGAALADLTALSGGRSTGTITIEGQPQQGSEGPEVAQTRITSGFFGTLGVPVRAGRDFTDADRDGAQQVVIVNEAFVRRFWPGENALGKRINDGSWWTVVGVVADARLYSIFDPAEPAMFQPMLQNPAQRADLQVRTAGDPIDLIPQIRRELATLDGNAAGTDYQTLEYRYKLQQHRFTTNAILVSLLGALALILAVVGLYATVSHSVAQRTHEIGVRVAVGARRSDVLRLIFRSSVQFTVTGVVLGCTLALLATRAIRHWLYGVTALEPMAYLLAVLVLVGAVAFACWWPARRALRVDPLVALRTE